LVIGVKAVVVEIDAVGLGGGVFGYEGWTGGAGGAGGEGERCES